LAIINKDEKFYNQRELMINSLYHFCAFFWVDIEGNTYQHNWVHKVLCRNLEAVFFGVMDDLVINIPPGFGKSYICNIFFPAWIWVQDPNFNIQQLSLAPHLGERDSQRFYNLICSEKFLAYFGDIYRIPETKKNIKKRKSLKKIHNSHKGVREYTALTGTLTGIRGDIIILDDPNDVTHVEQENARKRINDKIRYLRTRDNNNVASKSIMIQQRMHEADATSVALEMHFKHLCLPMYKDSRTIIPIGAELDPREEGDILCPEILDEVRFEKKKRDLPAVYLQSQYYQNPTPDADSIINKEYMVFEVAERQKIKDLVTGCSRMVISVDSAYKDSDKSDYAVISAVLAVGRKRYVVDLAMGQWDFSITAHEVIAMYNRWNKSFGIYAEIIIEDKSNGQAIIKTLEKLVRNAVIKGVSPLGSKRARLMAVSPFFQNYDVVFLKNPIWATYDKLYGSEPGVPLHELIFKQYVYFGYAANDDIPDSINQALLELMDDGEPIQIVGIASDGLSNNIDWSSREQKVYAKIF